MEKDLKEQLEPTSPPWVSEPLGKSEPLGVTGPLASGESEREVDMESLLPAEPPAKKFQQNPAGTAGPSLARSFSAARAARKRFWARFRARNCDLEPLEKEAEEFAATVEKYTNKEPGMNIQLESKPRPNPKLWIRIKLDAKKHEPFFVDAHCTKYTQDQGDIRLELVVNLENMQKLVGNYGKSQAIGHHSLIRHMAISDIEILRSGNGKRSWLLRSSKQRRVCFEIQNITTEMLPSRLFRVSVRCSKV